MDHIITSSLPSTACPFITVDISTSAEALDLPSNTPFTITLTLTLHHRMAVTFRRECSDLFSKPLFRHGLTFTNTTTGRLVNRTKRSSCAFGGRIERLPTEGNKAEWTTLFSEEPYLLEVSIKPVDGFRVKWPFLANFEEGGIYEIGLSDQAGIRVWIEGSLEEILAMRTANSIPQERFDFVIDFHVRETTTFEVKGPDLDGSLECPMFAKKKKKLMDRDSEDNVTR